MEQENGRYCHNLFMDSVARTFPENVFIEATVLSAMDNSPVMGATVQTYMPSDSGITSGVTDGNGIARIPVYNNGTYAVYVNGDGYENANRWIVVSCADSNCSPQLLLSVSPVLDADTAMVILNWARVWNMNLRSIRVDASSSDQFCNTDEGSDAGSCPDIEGGDAIRISNLQANDIVSYMIIVTGRNRNSQNSLSTMKRKMRESEAAVTFTTHDSSRKVGIDRKLEFEYSLRGVLIFGGWASISEIFGASEEEQRNA